MDRTGDVDYALLRELRKPADTILTLGLVALRQQNSEEQLKEKWQELKTSWETYQERFFKRLGEDAEQELRSTLTLARLLIALSLWEQGKKVPGITDFFNSREMDYGRLLAGEETMEVFTYQELAKEAQRNPPLRQLLVDVAQRQQEGLTGLLKSGIGVDLAAAFKDRYAARLRQMEEAAQLYHLHMVNRQMEKEGPGAGFQSPDGSRATVSPQETKTAGPGQERPTVNITGPVDGPIIIKQELKSEGQATVKPDNGKAVTSKGTSLWSRLRRLLGR